MISSLHHISIIVSSEYSLDLFRLLGFTEAFRRKRSYDIVVLMDGHGIQLEVFIDPRHGKRGDGLEEPLGIRHFALRVDDLEKEIERIQNESQTKIKCGPIMTDWMSIRFCYVEDYDGLVIELHE